MNYRLIIFEMMAVSCIAGTVCPIAAEPKDQPIANVLVWVRDGRGAPVSGLTTDDLAVTENGLSDRVVGVESFYSGVQIQSQDTGSSPTGVSPHDGQNPVDIVSALTHTLILIEPMAAGPRNYAIKDALRFFSTPGAGNWRVALVDDEGNFLPYSRDVDRIRSTLKRLERHYAPHAPQGPWSATVQSTVRELGVLPGRHVIVLISTHDSMYSSMLAGLAIASQAAMYTIDSAGPTVTVPLGGAAEFQSTEAGPIPFTSGEFAAQELSGTLSKLGYTNTGLGWSEHAAEETGGLSVAGVRDAFEHIAADAAGYYLVSFEARAEESGGTFSPFSIAVKRPHLDVKGPRYYMIPPEGTSAQMPADMKSAIQSVQNQKSISVVANSWLFPDQGSVHWGVFAADLTWLDGTPPVGSRVKIFAELINGSMHGLSATWFEEKVWTSDGSVLHWQKDGSVWPGSYTLRVTAMDTESGKIAFGTRMFMARLLDVPAFRFSGIVLADACLPATEQPSGRQNLFDPLVWNGCKMAPAANARFKSNQNVDILVRIYPPGEKVSRLVLGHWKAYTVIDDMPDKATELRLSAAEVRGLSVTGVLKLNHFDLAAGEHRLTVLFVIPGQHSQDHKIPLQTTFSIAQ
jgi:VWFA-related protein